MKPFRKTFMPDSTLKALEQGKQIEMRLSSFGTRIVDDKLLITIGMEPEMWVFLAALLKREGSIQASAFVESLVAGFEYLAEAWQDDDLDPDDDDHPDCAN